MRLLRSLLTASLLIAGSLAAKKSSTDRFNDFHTKALKTSPIKLSETTYKSLTTAPRDYSVAILLTALDARFGCQLCREFQPEWELLGKSWTKGDKRGDSRLLFGTLDFADGRDVFMSVSAIPLGSSLMLEADCFRSLGSTPPRSSCCSNLRLAPTLSQVLAPTRFVTTLLQGEDYLVYMQVIITDLSA